MALTLHLAVVCLTATRLMIDIFFTMSKRGGANNQVLTTLFKPPNPLVDSFESMYADMDKSKTTLLALHPEDAAGVLNVIMALQLKAYITAGATINDMPEEHKQAFRIVADEMESQADDQAVPLDLEQMQYYGGKLRVTLQSRNLQPVPATSTATAAKASKSEKAPKHSATDALEARLRKLEQAQAIPPKPSDKRRGGGRGRGAARGADRGGRRSGSSPSADFECLCCGQTGCVPSTCSKGNKEAQRKRAERRSEREAANKEKAARRLRQGALNVSEDEVSSKEETEEQCVASQSSSSPSPSQQLPHSSVKMLGTIHYETPTAASTQASISATLPSTEKEDPLPGKRIAQITVAPILPQFLREGLATYQDNVVHLYQAQCRVQPAPDTTYANCS